MRQRIDGKGLARAISTFTLGLVLAGCSGAEREATPTADATDREDVQAVIAAHERLTGALETGDVDALMALLEDSPDLVIFHPRLVSRFDMASEVKKGFSQMARRMKSGEFTEVHAGVALRGHVAWHTSHVVLESEDFVEPFLGRATEIWVRGEAGWRLAHAHWSEIPER